MLNRLRTSPFLKGFIGALVACLGVVIGLLLVHLWSDHTALHVLVDFLNQHADKIAKLP